MMIPTNTTMDNLFMGFILCSPLELYELFHPQLLSSNSGQVLLPGEGDSRIRHYNSYFFILRDNVFRLMPNISAALVLFPRVNSRILCRYPFSKRSMARRRLYGCSPIVLECWDSPVVKIEPEVLPVVCIMIISSLLFLQAKKFVCTLHEFVCSFYIANLMPTWRNSDITLLLTMYCRFLDQFSKGYGNRKDGKGFPHRLVILWLSVYKERRSGDGE